MKSRFYRSLFITGVTILFATLVTGIVPGNCEKEPYFDIHQVIQFASTQTGIIAITGSFLFIFGLIFGLDMTRKE